MKKLLSVLLATVLLLTCIPLGAIPVLAEESTPDSLAEEEYIYYSDLFYGYSIYLTETYNSALLSLEQHRMQTTNNIIHQDYINTGHFYTSVVSQGLSIATDPAGTVKYFTDYVGATNFQFNDELDKANVSFVKKLCETNLLLGETGSLIKENNKYVKKMNGFLKAVQAIERAGLLDEAYYEGLDKAEVYSTMYEQSMAYYKEYFTQINPSQSFNTQLHTALSEMTNALGGITTAADFTYALCLSLLMQDAQIELIQDIIDTQPTSSTLYKGLTRLKNQLKNGWMSYFIDTFVKGKVYEQVVGKVSGKINNWIMGDWTSYYSAVTAVVNVVNTVVFEWILGADYEAYRSALMLDTYASDLCDSVKNKALTFQTAGFTTKDIEKYELLFNAYIAMSRVSLDACQDLAIHNPTYTETYLNEQLKFYDNDNIYTDYLDDVKAYVLSIPKENRIITDFGSWNIIGDVTLCSGSDTIKAQCIYFPAVGLKANIYKSHDQKYNDMAVSEGDSIKLLGDMNLYFNTSGFTIPFGSYLEVDGDFEYICASFSGSSGTSANLTNYGELKVLGDARIAGSYSYYFGGSQSVKVYNYGMFNVTGNVTLDVIASECKNDGEIYCGGLLTMQGMGVLNNNNFIQTHDFYLSDAVNMPYSDFCFNMDQKDATLIVQGSFKNDYGNSSFDSGWMLSQVSGKRRCNIVDGNVVFDGNQQQEIGGLSAANIKVTNPAGIKYTGSVYLYGEYNLNGNPLDNNGYSTYLYNGCSFADDSDYKDLYVREALELPTNVKGNLTGSTITIPEGVSVTIDGNVSCPIVNNGHLHITGNFSNARMENHGLLEVDGDVTSTSYNYYLYQQAEGAELRIGGNFDWYSTSYCKITAGKVVFDGTEQQTIDGLIVKNLEVTNPAGIKYLSSVYLYGEYKLNGNPLDNNGYYTCLYNGCSFADDSDYGELTLAESVELSSDVEGNIHMSGSSILTIPDGVSVTIDGNVCCPVTNNGTLIIVDALHISGSSYAKIINNGKLYAYSDVLVERGPYSGAALQMSNPNAILFVGGDFSIYNSSYCKITTGTVVFNGDELQTVSGFSAPAIVLNNTTEEGVVFSNSIKPSVLFDHRGNNFTLYNNGSGSTFVDYDGDGMKDNVDPEPTVGNPCTLHFQSADIEKGTVSVESVETIGGTKVTVEAIPTAKYEFVRWEDSSGTTVSTSAKWEAVAQGDNTYTAIFQKRSQPITVQAENGTITVPSNAVIESTVTVAVKENAGYIYEEGSLAYNGIPIADNTFVMPDEPVTLTATFIRNDNYFALTDVLTTAKSYTYKNYSADSFATLTQAISVAEGTLYNRITEEESNAQIALLQSAIDGLQEKYVVSMDVRNMPTFYVNVPSALADLTLGVTYDNGTTKNITANDCTITGLDLTAVGDQTVTLTHEGFEKVVEICVELRKFEDCSGLEVTDVLFTGQGQDYKQNFVITYPATGEQLVEGVDYEVVYSNNTDIGTATVTVSAKGIYVGSFEATYRIYCVHSFDNVCDVDCNVCGIVRTPFHVYDNACDLECNSCGAVREIGEATPVVEQDILTYANTGNLAADNLSIFWTSDNFRFLCEKNTATTAIRISDSDHFRVYAGNEVTITGKNGEKMAAIEITCTSSTYATRLSSMAISNGWTVSVNDTVVTFTADSPATELIITADLQFRLSNVYIVPHNEVASDHAYDDEYDADCNICGAIREVKTPSFDGYITNGDFETGILAPWDTVWWPDSASVVEGRDGGSAMRVVCSNQWQFVHQVVDVEPNTDYIITGWYKDVTDMALLAKDEAHTNIQQVRFDGGDDWTQVVLSFNSGDNAKVLVTLMGCAADSKGAFDDIVMFKKSDCPHVYDDEYDVDCNICGAVRMADILTGGMTSVSEDMNGLAFQFDMVATNCQVVNGTRYVNGSASVAPFVGGESYTLVRMGAVVSNKSDATLDLENVDNSRTLNLEAVYLYSWQTTSLSFAVRVINIPEEQKDTVIYARPYYVYEKDGEEVIVYDDIVSKTYNTALNS